MNPFSTFLFVKVSVWVREVLHDTLSPQYFSLSAKYIRKQHITRM